MKRLQELLALNEESHGINVLIDNIEQAKTKVVQFVMMSPIHVKAHYNDYPSIDEEAEEYYDEFFHGRDFEGTASTSYSKTLGDSGELEDLLQAAEEYFNSEGEPGWPWPYAFEVTA